MTQCTNEPPGASGSSVINAKLFVPVGAPSHFSAGDASTPSQECFARNRLIVAETRTGQSELRHGGLLLCGMRGDGDAERRDRCTDDHGLHRVTSSSSILRPSASRHKRFIEQRSAMGPLTRLRELLRRRPLPRWGEAGSFRISSPLGAAESARRRCCLRQRIKVRGVNFHLHSSRR